MSEENIATRLKVFFDSKHLSSTQFADACGIARPSLSQILTGRNKKISDIIIGQIHRAFPELSVVWLLFGEGEMLLSDAKNCPENAEVEIIQDQLVGISENSKENGVNSPSNLPNQSVNQNVASNLRIPCSQMQIAVKPEKQRKISHITVYYDDQTFETFVPKK